MVKHRLHKPIPIFSRASDATVNWVSLTDIDSKDDLIEALSTENEGLLSTIEKLEEKEKQLLNNFWNLDEKCRQFEYIILQFKTRIEELETQNQQLQEAADNLFLQLRGPDRSPK